MKQIRNDQTTGNKARQWTPDSGNFKINQEIKLVTTHEDEWNKI